MCIRAGNTELESVKNLMSMSLMAVVADALNADLDNICEESHLVEDLKMTSEGEAELEAMIEDVFDGLRVNVNTTPTVSALLNFVVQREFAGLAV